MICAGNGDGFGRYEEGDPVGKEGEEELDDVDITDAGWESLAGNEADKTGNSGFCGAAAGPLTIQENE